MKLVHNGNVVASPNKSTDTVEYNTNNTYIETYFKLVGIESIVDFPNNKYVYYNCICCGFMCDDARTVDEGPDRNPAFYCEKMVLNII